MKYQNVSHFYRRKSEEFSLYLPRKHLSSKMHYNPYASKYPQSFYPSTLIPRAHVCTENPSDSWACDFCEVASFRTYEEAYRHERNCAMNKNTLSCHDHRNENQDKRLYLKQHMPLAMPGDKDSLSDRQCYVRSHFVETFTADKEDVSARHSKGAQKLHAGQIGIRCKHCTNRAPKNRAERSVCYPSSISRIYQTVADMQRFHFEVCTAIPTEMKNLYRSLKTTRPRGMGSPQSYWISSAKKLGLADTAQGIQLTLQTAPSDTTVLKSPQLRVEDCSTPSLKDSSTKITAVMIHQSLPPMLTPSSPESHSTIQSPLPPEETDISNSESPNRDSEANMLLSLRTFQAYSPNNKGVGTD